MEKSTCYTIGHSVHSTEIFVDLLKQHSIQRVVDVRSVPYSQHNPQFNRESINARLEKVGIYYYFLGNCLGAKYNDADLYFSDKPIVDFRKVRKLNSFKKGIDKIINWIKEGCKIALMCSEKDPFNCHRFVLVSYSLSKNGIYVKHILDNGNIVLNDVLEDKLIRKYKISYKQLKFFGGISSKKNAIERGYFLRNKDIGFSREEAVYTNGSS